MKKVEIHPEAVERVKKFTINDTVLGFGKYMSPIMIQGLYDNGEWQQFDLLPYGPISLDPCTKVLHYGQEIFEGMKAFRHPDEKVYMFRPEQNARRFNHSARRMAMPEIPEEQFLQCCDIITAYSHHLVPKRLGESLYLRPFMIATEVGLGIKPAKQFLFMIVASPSGAYFSGDSVKVYVEKKDIRAADGGTGSAKTGGNYAASLQSYKKTLEAGCDQTLWLDAVEHKYIEEMSGMNFFAIINGVLHTPSLTDTILNGITRHSIIEIMGFDKKQVVEKKMDINELLKHVEDGSCTEAFVCGTASVVAPISQFQLADGSIYHLKEPSGPQAMKIRERLIGIQAGRDEAPAGWLRPTPNLEF